MHPILFHIPLPKYPLPWAWLVLGVAGLSFLLALYFWFLRRDKSSALTAAGVGALAVVVRLGLRPVLRSVFGVESDTWNMGPIPIYSYGVMLGLSLVVGWYLTLGLAEKDGLPKETMANNYVVTAVAAVVGSRVLYIVTNLHEFDTFASMFAMRRGGLVAYGGFLGGLAGSYFFLKRHKIPLLPWADVAVPSLASGLMITRIGCYLFGCDFGQPLKESAPAFLKKMGTFKHWPEGTLDHGVGSPAWVQHVNKRGLSPTSTESLPVHPTQLYESLVGLLILLLLLRARRHQKFRGQIFLLFAYAYGVARYLLEVLRDDAERGSIPPSLPEHVLIPLGLVLFAIGWVVGFSKEIKSIPLQRATQVAAFLPAVGLYLALKPETFATAVEVQFSTSQFIGLLSGVGACAAFAVFYKAALDHPKDAMALRLPPEFLPEGAAPPPPKEQAEADDDEEERKPVRRTKKKKAKPKPGPNQPAEDTKKDEPAEDTKKDEPAEDTKKDDDER